MPSFDIFNINRLECCFSETMHSEAVAAIDRGISAVDVVDRSLMSIMQPQSNSPAMEQAENYQVTSADFPTLGENVHKNKAHLNGTSNKNNVLIQSQDYPDLMSTMNRRVTTGSTKRPTPSVSRSVPGSLTKKTRQPWVELGSDQFPSLGSNASSSASIVRKTRPLIPKSIARSKPKAAHKLPRSVPPGLRPFGDTVPIRVLPTSASNNPFVIASLNAPVEPTAMEASVQTVQRKAAPKPVQKQGRVNIGNTSDFPSLGKTVAKKPTFNITRKSTAKVNSSKTSSAKSHNGKKKTSMKNIAAMPEKAMFKLDDDFDSGDICHSLESSSSSTSFQSGSFDLSIKTGENDTPKVVNDKLFEKRVEHKEPVMVKEENNHRKKKDKKSECTDSTKKKELLENSKVENKSNVMNFLNDDFPSLKPTKTSTEPGKTAGPMSATHPPPGFGSVSLSTSMDTTKDKAPPGFVAIKPSAADELFPKFYNVDLDSISATYEKPPAFQERNKQLIADVLEALDNDQTSFTEFKELSGAFRRNDLGPAAYYCSCAKSMGEEKFQDIFVQLVSLLPDIRKQQELLIAHKHAMKSMKMNMAFDWSSDRLTICKQCYQVILNEDVDSHFSAHMFSNNDFPSLGGKCTTATSGNNWVRAK